MLDTSNDTRLDRKPIEGEIAELLIDVAVGEFTLPQPQFADVAKVTWAQLDAYGCRGTVALEGSVLNLLLDDINGVLADSRGTLNQPGTFVLVDGTSLSAKLVHLSEVDAKAHVDLHHWVWRNSGRPMFWTGELTGRLPLPGNLLLHEVCGTASRNRHAFRLEGRFTWYVIGTKEKDRFQVVLDAGGTFPEQEELRRDILALEFASGTPLSISPLVGLDEARRPVAAMVVSNYQRRRGGRRPPVPDLYTMSDWMPEIFSRVSAKLHSEGLDPLLRAIGAYLDSVTDHLDGCYLKAQIGLEAFAKRITHGADRPLLVRDEKQWRTWVKTLRETVLEHLKHPKEIDGVMKKLSETRFAPTGRIVADALGVMLPDEVREEIGNRDTIAHELFMNSGPEHEVDRDARRLQMVQTVLVALVAKYVGYCGPLQGYDPDKDGHRPSPDDWWPVTLTQRDLVWFHATRVVPAASHQPLPPPDSENGSVVV